MLDEINQKVEADVSRDETERADLLLDVEAVRVQLIRSTPNKVVILALLESLAECEQVTAESRQMIAMVTSSL